MPSPTVAALSRPLLALLLGSFALNAGSGVALWLWPVQGWRVFHGWTIPLFLIVMGIVWRVHVLRGWRIRKNIVSGILTLAVFLLLTATGWAIYYSGSDEIQAGAAALHTWLGLGVSALLLVHSLLGLWTRREETGVVLPPK